MDACLHFAERSTSYKRHGVGSGRAGSCIFRFSLYTDGLGTSASRSCALVLARTSYSTNGSIRNSLCRFFVFYYAHCTLCAYFFAPVQAAPYRLLSTAHSAAQSCVFADLVKPTAGGRRGSVRPSRPGTRNSRCFVATCSTFGRRRLQLGSTRGHKYRGRRSGGGE